MDRSMAIWSEIDGLYITIFCIPPPPTLQRRSYLSSAASKLFIFTIWLILGTILALGIAKTWFTMILLTYVHFLIFGKKILSFQIFSKSLDFLQSANTQIPGSWNRVRQDSSLLIKMFHILPRPTSKVMKYLSSAVSFKFLFYSESNWESWSL